MGKGPGRKNQKAKELPDYAVYANPAAHAGMSQIYRSSAAGAHVPADRKGSRGARKRAEIEEQR